MKFIYLVGFLLGIATLTDAQTCWCSFLLNYSATQQTDKKVKIHWETDTENNTAYDFIVQRSINNANNFVSIGYVSAHPNAQSYIYDFYDAYPCNNGAASYVYYRLKSVDIFSSIRYSTTLSVYINNNCPSCSNP